MGFFQRLKEGLFKTRSGLTDKVDELVKNTRVVDDDFYDELTDILILADVGVAATTEIIDKLKAQVESKKIKDADQAKEIFKQILIDEMNIPRPNLRWPMVMFVVGVNGVGKTTTIGKLAYQFKQAGLKVVLGAADTFRAAAVEQIAIWGERVGVPVVKQQMGSDPASVAFDTLQSAIAQGADVVLIDTAGRLHNKKGLMDELSKIKRVMQKLVPEAPHDVMLVLDGSTGQNAFEQAKQFTAATDVTSMAITKLDGTAKGGVVIGISDQFKIPVRYIGLGEGMEDLQAFNRVDFVNSLFK